jgi:predicted esterase
MEAEKFQSLADKYGVIVLYPTSPTGHWQLPDDLSQLHAIDSSIKVVLRTNAIDPDRLALLGFSEGGYSSLVLGLNNQDIFSRVAPMSFLGLEDRKGPTNPKTHFLVSGGIAEDMIRESVRAGQILRHDGNPVVTILGLRAHVDYVEDEDFVWSWILKSWDDPALTTRITTGRVPADSDPVLTVDALNKMTVFWTKFQQEPDSVHDVARMAHQEQLPLSLGAEPVFVISMNITDMAAKYPSVAADLHAAGLTAQQEAEYRAAILRVGFVRASGIAPGGPPASGDQRQHTPYAPIAPTSVLGKNLAFRRAHAAEFQALARTGMWTTQ